MKVFQRGERVSTPYGNGAVVSCRMCPPDYTEPLTYVVCLDKRKAESEKPPFPTYNGTVVTAHEVSEEKV